MEQKGIFHRISAYRRELMGFAALWIWFFHAWEPVFGSVPLLSQAEHFVKRIGFCGVDIFFFLSGMGLVYAIEKRSLRDYYKRRFWRVYPPFFIVAMLAAITNRRGLGGFLSIVSFQRFFAVGLGGTLWFIPTILLMYLCFPLYYRYFSQSRGKLRFTLIAIALWLGLSLALAKVLRRDFYGATNRIPVFLTGILAGWLAKNGSIVFTKGHWAGCAGLLLLGLGLAYAANYRHIPMLVPYGNSCIPTYLLAISLCCLLAGSFSRLDGRRGFSPVRRILGFYGGISLEFYCVQEWLDALLRNRLGSGGIVNLLSFICATAAAVLLQRVCARIQKKG